MAHDERTAPLATGQPASHWVGFFRRQVRSFEPKGSVSRGAAGIWPDVSFSPQAATTIQIRDSTGRPPGLRCPAPARPVGRPPKHDLSNWKVRDDWPKRIPVTDAEVDVFEAWFGDLFDELFGPCR